MEAAVTAYGVLLKIQAAKMAVKQYAYCVKAVNVTACYCLYRAGVSAIKDVHPVRPLF